ncbi:MAG: methylated-DNA--[protein]-cysteine S-methyltransferase [Acidobacteriota bacterium]
MVRVMMLASPIGELTLAARGDRVCLLHFGADAAATRRTLQRWYPGEAIEDDPDPVFDLLSRPLTAGAARIDAVTRLQAYFAGDVNALDSIEVELNGTAFQKQVWAALRGVRAGTTAAYTEIARAISAPSAIRAVGAANGANPVAVIVPCHRVIGANGSLTGYGGGLDRKRWLLEHEGLRLRF